MLPVLPALQGRSGAVTLQTKALRYHPRLRHSPTTMPRLRVRLGLHTPHRTPRRHRAYRIPLWNKLRMCNTILRRRMTQRLVQRRVMLRATSQDQSLSLATQWCQQRRMAELQTPLMGPEATSPEETRQDRRAENSSQKEQTIAVIPRDGGLPLARLSSGLKRRKTANAAANE